MLFISHRLDEVFALCQRVTVMRDGRHVVTAAIAETTTQQLIHAMVGRDMDALFPKEVAPVGEAVLKVDRLTREGVFTDISFEVRAGEIVALAGLVGAGPLGGRARDLRHRPRRRRRASRCTAAGCRPPRRTPRWRRASASCRRTGASRGSSCRISIERNMALASLTRLKRFLLIPRRAERRFASDWATRLQLRYGRLERPGLDALGRQPAEDRARQVARPRARRS